MITCCIRYSLDPDKTAEFAEYGRTWMRLIEKYGGTHHGYFLPAETPLNTTLSFEGLGREGEQNVAMALFSFPDVETYKRYRNDVSDDPECHAMTALVETTYPFTSYERTFLRLLDK